MRKKQNTSIFTRCLRLGHHCKNWNYLNKIDIDQKSTRHRKINKLLITFTLGWESILIKSVSFPPLKLMNVSQAERQSEPKCLLPVFFYMANIKGISRGLWQAETWYKHCHIGCVRWAEYAWLIWQGGSKMNFLTWHQVQSHSKMTVHPAPLPLVPTIYRHDSSPYRVI